MRRIIFALVALFTLLSVDDAGPRRADAWFADGSGELQGFNVGGDSVTPATITFLQCASNATNLTTYTFSAQNTGTASADRYTGVGITVADTATVFGVASVTVEAVGATEIVDQDGTFQYSSAIYIIANPSGTSEDVVVTFSEAVIGATICLWQINNLVSGTAVDTAAASGTIGAALVLDLDTSADGIAFGVCNIDSGTPIFDPWVGFTERTDAVGGDNNFTAADFDEDGTASTPLTVSCDATGTNDMSGVSASFR